MVSTTVKYVISLALLLSSLKAAAQSAFPFTVTQTGKNHTIFIKASVNPVVNDQPLQAGDVIAVFFSSGDTVACGGFTVWNNENTFITAYGDDGNNDGFKPGEQFKFKVWRSVAGCLVDDVTVSYNTGGVILNTDSFADNGISDIATLIAENYLLPEYFSIQITDATCRAGGKILLQPFDDYLLTGVEVIATNTVTGDSYSGELEVVQLPEGSYTLEIRKNLCSVQWPAIVFVGRDTNCDFPVISPNKDGTAEDFYIPFSGKARIYNREGELMSEFPIPSTWNATDMGGQLLPMGTYIIKCDGQPEIMITIIR